MYVSDYTVTIDFNALNNFMVQLAKNALKSTQMEPSYFSQSKYYQVITVYIQNTS